MPIHAPDTQPTVQARTVRGFCAAYGVGKTTVFELISAGRIVAVKVGRRTLIDEASARAWFGLLPKSAPLPPNLHPSLQQDIDKTPEPPRTTAANHEL